MAMYFAGLSNMASISPYRTPLTTTSTLAGGHLRPEAVALLETMYGPVKLFAPDDNGDGYVEFQVHGTVSYDGVTSVQRMASAAMEPFGGVCESWGVLQAP